MDKIKYVNGTFKKVAVDYDSKNNQFKDIILDDSIIPIDPNIETSHSMPNVRDESSSLQESKSNLDETERNPTQKQNCSKVLKSLN